MSKDKGELFSLDDLRGVALAWVKDSTSNPEDYLTKEGLAYLNGFVQANNSIELIKKEKYDTLLLDYEDLINKYEKLKEDYEEIQGRKNKAIKRVIELKNKKRWFRW